MSGRHRRVLGNRCLFFEKTMMQIVEATRNRLVMRSEQSASEFKLMDVALLINISVTGCYAVVGKNLPLIINLVLFFALFAVSRFAINFFTFKDETVVSREFIAGLSSIPYGRFVISLLTSENGLAVSYGAVVNLISIPCFGTIVLLLAAVNAALNVYPLPPVILVDFDRHKSLVTVREHKLPFWYLTTRYPLDAVATAERVTEPMYIGSKIVMVSLTRLTIRKKSGRLFKKNIVYGNNGDRVCAESINKFLLHTLK